MRRVRIQRIVTATRHAFLLVPHADRRAGRMAVIADRVRVNGRGDAFLLRLCERTREYVIAAPASNKITRQDILQPVAARQCRLEFLRRIGLARPEHVGVLLRVGIEAQVGDAEVHVQQGAG